MLINSNRHNYRYILVNYVTRRSCMKFYILLLNNVQVHLQLKLNSVEPVQSKNIFLLCFKIMINEDVEEKILAFYENQRWEDIVNLDCALSELDKNKLFWVLPTINDLHWMKDITDKYNLVGLTSIGCGCGLFEWLFQKYSGLNVIGIELDHSWWRSKYSPPLFLENMIFVRANNTKIYLPENYALFFCYFNNGPAFCNYIENYKGHFVFIIGPRDGQNRSTDPMPFDTKFNKYGWKLISYKNLERTNDCIAVYSK